MKLKKEDCYFFISSILTLFVPAGFVTDIGKMYAKYLVFILLVMGSFTLFLLYKASFGKGFKEFLRGITKGILWRFVRVVIVRNGLESFFKELDKYSKTGGIIFTTAIFENYSGGDKVLRHMRKMRFDKQLTYERFVFLDDPTFEYEWIKDFLDLKDIENLIPVVYRVKAEKRAISRKIAKAIPKFSVSIYYDSEARINRSYIGFIGVDVKRNFGIIIENKIMNNLIANNIAEYKDRADTITNIIQIPVNDRSLGLPERFISCIEEYAGNGSEIEFFGIFGSHGLVYQNKLALTQKSCMEGDTDMIIVVTPETDIPKFRERMESLLKEQVNSDDHLSIEWSNLDGKYYEKRNPIHIDIQLHKRGDRYYMNRELLGYSIFDKSLYKVFSKGHKTIYEHIQYPIKAIEKKARIQMVLNTPEYGINTAIERTKNDNFPKIDPCRLLWISIQNYIWAMTGFRIRIKENLFDYIKDQDWFSSQNGRDKIILKQFFNEREVPDDITKHWVNNILRSIEKELIGCLD